MPAPALSGFPAYEGSREGKKSNFGFGFFWPPRRCRSGMGLEADFLGKMLGWICCMGVAEAIPNLILYDFKNPQKTRECSKHHQKPWLDWDGNGSHSHGSAQVWKGMVWEEGWKTSGNAELGSPVSRGQQEKSNLCSGLGRGRFIFLWKCTGLEGNNEGRGVGNIWKC